MREYIDIKNSVLRNVIQTNFNNTNSYLGFYYNIDTK